MSLRSGTRKKKKVDSAQMRLPEKNPRYEYVRSTLDTGSHQKNRVVRWDTSKEIFKRISVRKLGAAIENQQASAAESIYNSDLLDASPTASVIEEDEERGPNVHDEVQDVDYLLLDLRTEEEYETCRIKNALHYPAIKLRRDQYISEMYSYKNRANKFIVIYDNDGYNPAGIAAATHFVEKGFDNVLLLSGGLIKFADHFPLFILGSPPEPPSEPGTRYTSAMPSRAASRKSSVAGTPRGRRSARGGRTPRRGRGSRSATPRMSRLPFGSPLSETASRVGTARSMRSMRSTRSSTRGSPVHDKPWRG